MSLMRFHFLSLVTGVTVTVTGLSGKIEAGLAEHDKVTGDGETLRCGR